MEKLKIGIILGSTRGRAGQPQVENGFGGCKEQNEAEYRNHRSSRLSPAFPGKRATKRSDRQSGTKSFPKWTVSSSSFPEYNHSISAVLKNAIDSARDAWANKARRNRRYGSLGGQAAEHLRGYLRKCRSRTCARIPRFRSSMILKT